MTLSIITINYNNAAGLKKTMKSVLNQTSRDFEYIVVDGAAPLNPPDRGTIENFVAEYRDVENGFQRCTWLSPFGGVGGGFYSEPDNGIYNAMNKGIQMAKGEYVQFLNSSDTLVAADVTERMIKELEQQVEILYGNMLKRIGDKVIYDKGFEGRQPTLLDFYSGTLNHSPVYIRRSLFDRFGLYDETLKYVSDWKWYVQAILFGGMKPLYVNIDVVDFDMSGVSTSNWEKTLLEKQIEMEKLFPVAILNDYADWAFGIDQLKRLKRHPWAYKLVYLLERVLFKIEKKTLQ